MLKRGSAGIPWGEPRLLVHVALGALVLVIVTSTLVDPDLRGHLQFGHDTIVAGTVPRTRCLLVHQRSTLGRPRVAGRGPHVRDVRDRGRRWVDRPAGRRRAGNARCSSGCCAGSGPRPGRGISRRRYGRGDPLAHPDHPPAAVLAGAVRPPAPRAVGSGPRPHASAHRCSGDHGAVGQPPRRVAGRPGHPGDLARGRRGRAGPGLAASRRIPLERASLPPWPRWPIRTASDVELSERGGSTRPDILEWVPISSIPFGAAIPWIVSVTAGAFVLIRSSLPFRPRDLAVIVVLAVAAFRVNRLDAFLAIAVVVLLAPEFAQLGSQRSSDPRNPRPAPHGGRRSR